MEATVSGLDRIRDRSEAMSIENNFYKTLETASVQYACDEVARIMNLTNDKECYIPSSDLVLHILRWLTTEITAKCGNMQWRNNVKDLISQGLRQLRRAYEEEGEDDGTRQVVMKKRRTTTPPTPSQVSPSSPGYESPPASFPLTTKQEEPPTFEFSPASPSLTQMVKWEEEEEEEESPTSPPMSQTT
ncbi:hypothetical protein LSAT2_019964, partial [Lamellibrachia satsuma]